MYTYNYIAIQTCKEYKNMFYTKHLFHQTWYTEIKSLLQFQNLYPYNPFITQMNTDMEYNEMHSL